ncbi:hypothetical protein [Streptomyces sp. NPDC001744]|uniref:hypothetical protein n=1 Tax=Streptomyces sp. NPDC001744 TaxID=3364606 RepID=UPI0036C3A252
MNEGDENRTSPEVSRKASRGDLAAGAGGTVLFLLLLAWGATNDDSPGWPLMVAALGAVLSVALLVQWVAQGRRAE